MGEGVRGRGACDIMGSGGTCARRERKKEYLVFLSWQEIENLFLISRIEIFFICIEDGVDLKIKTRVFLEVEGILVVGDLVVANLWTVVD